MLLVAIAVCLGACYIISLKNKESKLSILGRDYYLSKYVFFFYLRNELNFWNVHGIMNTSGLLQSK